MAVGAMADEPYHIGVWYFLRWSSAANTAPGLHRYGGTDPWAGVRQFAEGRPPFQITGGPNFTDRKPLIGFYDQMDQSVIDTQIQQAASEGIEFFAFYWYINPITGQELHGVEPVKKFFGSSVRTLKYVLAPLVVDTYKEHLDLRTWTTTVVPQIVSYMRSDAYFRIDGRPLLIDFWLPFDGRAEAYAELRRSVREAIGVDPLIVLLLGGNPHYQDLQFQASHVHPDGFTCFNMGTTRPDKPYADVVHEWLANTLAQSGSSYFPTKSEPGSHPMWEPRDRCSPLVSGRLVWSERREKAVYDWGDSRFGAPPPTGYPRLHRLSPRQHITHGDHIRME